MPFFLAPLHSQNTLTQGAKLRRSVLQRATGRISSCAHSFAIVGSEDRPVGKATVSYINYDAKAAATVLAQVAACRRLFGGELGCEPSPTVLQATGVGVDGEAAVDDRVAASITRCSAAASRSWLQ